MQKTENNAPSVFIQFGHAGIQTDITECLSSFKNVYKQWKHFCRSNPWHRQCCVRGSVSSTRASAIPCWSLGNGTLLALGCHRGVTDLIYNRLTKSSLNSLKMTVSGTLLPGLPAYVVPQLCTCVLSQHCSHRYNGLTDPDWPPCPTPPSRPGGRDPAPFLGGPGILPSSWYIMDSKITVDKSVPRSKLCQEEFSENMRTSVP